MLYAITAIDRPGAESARKDNHGGHLDHFRAHKSQIALAGPLTSESGGSGGSLVIFEADSEADARAFIEGDPFFAAGVWENISVAQFKPSIHASEKLG